MTHRTWTNDKLSARETMRIAVDADVDIRTVNAYLSGEKIQDAKRVAIEKALKDNGHQGCINGS